tara:strand:- start:797 stop:1762 length:966 start_codon:yes stop_codon:yes gene_type:complete
MVDSHLGIISKELILDEEVANIAFLQPINTVSQPIDGMLGISVIYVDEIYDATTPSLDDVYETIFDELSLQEATNLMDELYFEIEEQFLDGQSLYDVAQTFDLGISTFEKIDINGIDINDNEIGSIKNEKLLEKLFTTNLDDYIEVTETDDSFIWIKLNSINEPYIKTFKNVRNFVTKDMIDKRKNEKETEIVNLLKDRLERDLEVTSVLSEYETSIQSTEPFSRNNPIKEFTDEFNDRILSSDLGDVIVGKSNEDILVGKVVKIIPNKDNLIGRDAEFNDNINMQFKNDLFEQFLISIEENYEVKIYQENINRLFNNQNL